MRTNLLLASMLSVASLSACVGGFDDPNTAVPPDTGSAGKKLFEATVKPMLVAQCANCHTGDQTTQNAFLGTAPQATAYEYVTRDAYVVGAYVVKSAGILNKGTHSGVTWWTADQSAKITAWLTQEATDRGVSQTEPTSPPVNTPSTTSIMAMQKFAGCMATSKTDWDNVGNGPAYRIAQTNANPGGQCDGCHDGGAGAYLASRKGTNYSVMFERTQEQLFFTGLFSTEAVAGTPVTYKVVANETKLCAKGIAPATGAKTHPTYNCNNNGQMTNLKAFVQKVNDKLATGTCGTPGFRPSPT
jgi:pyrimidine deaminase RibD-like protein